jgi:hypothetical protein
MEKDPIVRLSVTFLWATMTTEKLEGKERSNPTVMFNPKDGYYLSNPDLTPMTPLKLDPTLPATPTPRITPLYHNGPAPAFVQETSEEAPESKGVLGRFKESCIKMLKI